MAAEANAAALRAALAECRRITDVSERAQCYDRLADHEAMAAKSAVSAPQASGAAPPTASLAPSPPVAGDPSTEAKLSASTPAPKLVEQTSANLITGEVGKVSLTVSDVTVTRTDESQLLTMAMSDGTSWIQSEPKRIKQWPKSGDPVLIRKALMGYWCELGEREKFHCRPRPASK